MLEKCDVSVDIDVKAMKVLDDLCTFYAMSTFSTYWNNLRRDFRAGMLPYLLDVKMLTTQNLCTRL